MFFLVLIIALLLTITWVRETNSSCIIHEFGMVDDDNEQVEKKLEVMSFLSKNIP